jgi:phenylpyruvate tautomerase PptA (4-oxalocrotonate tautomerase family)
MIEVRSNTVPIYRCSAPEGALTGSMKARMAEAITDAHSEETGAPRAFVRVFFHDVPRGDAYISGRLDTESSMIEGSIRAGRTLETKQRLLKRISASWQNITGLSQMHLVAWLTEFDSSNSMEFGLILPHAGEEAEWLAAHPDVLQRAS